MDKEEQGRRAARPPVRLLHTPRKRCQLEVRPESLLPPLAILLDSLEEDYPKVIHSSLTAPPRPRPQWGCQTLPTS